MMKKYKIMLACMGGFSTSMLVSRMKQAAMAKEIDVTIDAVGESELEKFDDLDIILLGPQVSHLLEEITSNNAIPVEVINEVDYGMMNGENVLNHALKRLVKSEGV